MTEGIYASGREACARALAPKCRAVYDTVRVSPSCVWVVDCSVDTTLNVPSITNDADAVVAQLYARYGKRRFLYQDTNGDWDELLHQDGKFIDFRPARGEGPGVWADD